MMDGERETRQLRLGFIGAAVEKLHWLALKWMSHVR